MIGIDESHRCPVVGSLVVVAVKCDDRKLRYFNRIGIKDSKKLTRQRRFLYFNEIVKHCDYRVKYLTPETISNADNLNKLEVYAYMSALMNLDALAMFNSEDVVVIDNFEPSRESFLNKAMEFTNLITPNEWIIEHYADENYTICSMASILAKCFSDIEMDTIRRYYYDVGSGNPNDLKTLSFLYKCKTDKNYKELSKLIRKNWITWKRLEDKKELNKLRMRLKKHGMI